MSERNIELMDFWAEWCGPCKMMAPTMEEFEQDHPEIKITKVNIDENEELAEKYEVSSIPCLVLLEDGKEVKRNVGVMSLKKLEKFVGV